MTEIEDGIKSAADSPINNFWREKYWSIRLNQFAAENSEWRGEMTPGDWDISISNDELEWLIET